MNNASTNIKRKNDALMNYEFRNNIARVKSYPTYIGVAVNKSCNVDCIFCSIGPKTNEKIEWDHFRKLENIFHHVSNVVFSGEEVILHPDIWKMFGLLAETGVFTTFMTNGKALKENVMERLVDHNVGQITCSFHGATPETYQSIVRGADFNQIIKQFEYLKRYRLNKAKILGDLPNPNLHFHYVMMRRNLEELPAFLEIAVHLGAHVVVSKFMLIFNHLKHLIDESLYFYPELTNSVLKHCILKAENLPLCFIAPKLFKKGNGEGIIEQLREIDLGEEKYPICSWPWRQCNISMGGHVQPCCGALPSMGNIYETPFEEIWNCEKYIELRATVNTPNRWPECRNCVDVAGAVTSDDIRRHLVYLDKNVSNQEIEKIIPETINGPGQFSNEERLTNAVLKILGNMKHGIPMIRTSFDDVFDLISQLERDYLFDKIHTLNSFNKYHSSESILLMLIIRFLNYFNHAYIAYRIITSMNTGDTFTFGEKSNSYSKWINLEKMCSEFAVGYYNAGLEGFKQSLPLMKEMFGEQTVMIIVGLLMEQEWKEASTKLNHVLELNIPVLISGKWLT